MAEIRTRFAPSPSGHLHVGGARTALFCWAYARRHGGTFLLRIEDTDRKRSSDTASMAFLEDLQWLGIAWDGEPEASSDRLGIYREHADRLIADGKAYWSFDTPEELDRARAAARAEKRDFLYREYRKGREPDEATVARWLEEDRPRVLRLRGPEGREVVFDDELLGEVAVPPEKLDDFVILKADGWPTYHLAVVVDDHEMGVTHVIRGQEHLNNTPRHVLLLEAFGWPRPVWAHLGLIFNPDGSKMSKRDKDRALRRAVSERGLESSSAVDPETWDRWLADEDRQLDVQTAEALAAELSISLPEVDVDDFRRAGYLPEVMVNYLALLGWRPGGDVEKFDRDWLVERFGLDRLTKSAARFDREKLLAFNLDAIQAMTPEEFAGRWREHCARYHPEFTERLSPEAFDRLAAANQVRSKTLEGPVESSRFFVIADDEVGYGRTKAVRKALVKGETNGFAHLEAILPRLRDVSDWSEAALEEVLGAYAEEAAGGKLGKVAQPIRVAVSGGPVSPAIFETMVILGRDSVLNRIERCLSKRDEISE